MATSFLRCLIALCALAAIATAAPPPVNLAQLRQAFLNPPADARILMRWWWFGPAVTKPELERELRAMQAAGIGGVEVQPVYPLALDDPEHGLLNLPYLSPEFLDALRFTGEQARALGLRLDLTLTSGWPYGGPHIPISQASAMLKMERIPVPAGAATVPLPALAAGERLIAAFLATGERQLPSRIPQIDDSAAHFPAINQPRLALVLIAGRTRQMVKRAAVGAEGFVLDHYNRAALQTHLDKVGEPLLAALAKTPPYAIFSDSLEVYNADWTDDFLAEFRARRGYDLLPYLPALFGDYGGQSLAIRHDWGQTLTELANERYLDPLREWAHRHGALFRSQTYGIPPVGLSSNARVDLPEGEGWQWRQFSTSRWASSAGHLYHRPVISSETWTWLHSPAFRATPLDLKAEADLHFLEGINQLVGHGWPYSPPSADPPGWRFYAAAALNDHNPWWPVMPDIAGYLQRLSALLRQGEPVNDVALYLPTHDVWAGFAPGKVSLNQPMPDHIGPNVIPRILDAGYGFDFIDDEAIARVGLSHRILILPGVERIPLATYRAIERFARSGGTVIAVRRTPAFAPGLREAATDTPAIRALSQSLFAAGAPGRFLPNDSRLTAALHAALAPDAVLPPEIGFVHRKLPYADVFFVVNTSNRPIDAQTSFRVANPAVARWDPRTGRAEPPRPYNAATPLGLHLEPYESTVLVFSAQLPENEPPVSATPPSPIDLSTNWTVGDGQPPSPVTMDVLRPWTSVAGREFFSGSITYEKTFSLEPEWLGHRVFLTFGEGTPVNVVTRRSGSGMRAQFEGPVREAALVYVNEKIAGPVWCPPYEVEVGNLLQRGPNSLRVVVSNLALNLLAKGPLPDYQALNARYGERFQPQDLADVQPVPAGLTGPVRLLAR